MRAHLLSDLHTGSHPFGEAKVCADVLLLAGDISDGASFSVATVAANYLAQGKPVFYVPGNHEFYGTRYPRELRRLHRQCRQAGITMLHNRAVIVDGVRFIGATLWTDFQLYGKARQVESEFAAKYGISDFSCIFDGAGRVITPAMTTRWHAKSRRILEALLAQPFEGPTVVLTHHAPDERSVHPRWAGNKVNPAFSSNLRDVLRRYQPALWAHGHTHDSFRYFEGNSLVAANPRGYKVKRFDRKGQLVWGTENEVFNPELVFSLKAPRVAQVP